MDAIEQLKRPLLDAGHAVGLLDAECLHLSREQILEVVRRFDPALLMTGHAGSTPAHPVCVDMLRAIKQSFPSVLTVYGGVYPTYHARRILEREPAIDVIVRGEGEATAVELAGALDAIQGRPPAQNNAILAQLPGLACRATRPTATDLQRFWYVTPAHIRTEKRGKA
jgi:anaerobic magnesium-protoporphyrin IX monomethyl ester cyclase